MKIAIRICGRIIVHDDIDTFNVDTTTEDICGNQNALFEGFKCGVPADPEVEKHQ